MAKSIGESHGDPTPDDPRRLHARHVLVLSAFLLLAAGAALWVDVSLGRWCLDTFAPPAGSAAQGANRWWASSLIRLLRFAEPFGHALGVIVILLAIFQLDPGRRWGIPRVVTAALGAGLAVDVLKLLVVRTRPHSFSFEGPVWSTFGGWFPLGSAGSTGQSLASGHTATAVGLALALVWLYPRGRWLFPALATLVACQRVQSGAHWLSDVLVAAAVGCLVSVICLYVGPIPRAFDRWEAGWRRGTADGRRTKDEGLGTKDKEPIREPACGDPSS